MEISKTFCVYPWVHQMVDTTGSIKLCCVADDPTDKVSGQNMHVNKQSLSEAWNSEYMVSVRERLISGRQVKDCGQCYRKERLGEYSFRQKTNDDWSDKIQEIQQHYKDYEQQYTEANDFMKEKMQMSKYIVNDMPKYLDIRFGNLCNLKCRMCTGKYSNKLGEELEAIANKDEQFRLLAPDSAKTYKFDWYDNPNFWQDLDQYIPHIELIYLTGGEPTLVEGNYEFLNKLVDKGYSQNISLVFNTNVTNFQQRFLDVIGNFKYITLNLSIDGTVGIQEYIRYPSKWSAVVKNMNNLMNRIPHTNTKFELVFTPTVSIMNVGWFDKLIDWAYNFSINNTNKNINWDMMPIFLHGPQFQDMIYATEKYREYTLGRIQKIQPKVRSHFESLDRFLKEIDYTLSSKHDPEESSMYRKQLLHWNSSIDKSRDIKIQDYIPYSHLLYE